MAEIYDTGHGRAVDHAKAMTYCEATAKRKFIAGERCLAFHYQHGLGTAQDSSHALKLYKEAADAGDLYSMYLVAQMYWRGEGVQPDKSSAFQYLFLANTSNDADVARDFLKLKSEMSEKEIKRGTDKAREWTTKHTLITGMSVQKQ